MLKPEVSVIMPAYNAALYVAESIKSVMSQTYANWELLIVDDGSVDNTKDIIQNFCKKDSRIHYFFQQNGKQGKARNLALSHATGNYIAFLDADDIWLPEKLEIQLKEIEEKKADLVFSESYLFTDNVSHSTGLLNSGKGYFNGEKGLKSFLEINKILPSSVLVKAKAISSVKRFTEKLSIQNAEDYHLWLKLLMNGNVFYGSELILVNYRIHTASASYNDKLSVAKTLEVLEDLKKNYKPYKKILNDYHKIWFTRYHYATNKWDKENYKQLIKKNCSYIGKPLFNFFLQTAYTLFGFEFTRRLANKLLNTTKL